MNGGLHYVSAPTVDRIELCVSGSSCTLWIPISDQYVRSRYGQRFDVELGAGTAVRVTPHFGLRFDVNMLLFTGDEFYDRAVRPSIGMNWRF